MYKRLHLYQKCWSIHSHHVPNLLLMIFGRHKTIFSCILHYIVNYKLKPSSSRLTRRKYKGAGLAPMPSLPVQDGGPHDFRSKMAAPTTSDPRWRPPTTSDPRWRSREVRNKMAVPVTRSVTPRRVSQRPRPREGSVTS